MSAFHLHLENLTVILLQFISKPMFLFQCNKNLNMKKIHINKITKADKNYLRGINSQMVCMAYCSVFFMV